MAGLCLWHGARSHCHAEIRHPRSSRLFRSRSALAPALRLPGARCALARRGADVKFTLGWLKDHLDTAATIEEIRDGLIGAGLEVEDISDPAQALAPFTVARVIEARPHPNADRLQVLDVETIDGR